MLLFFKCYVEKQRKADFSCSFWNLDMFNDYTYVHVFMTKSSSDPVRFDTCQWQRCLWRDVVTEPSDSLRCRNGWISQQNVWLGYERLTFISSFLPTVTALFQSPPVMQELNCSDPLPKLQYNTVIINCETIILQVLLKVSKVFIMSHNYWDVVERW